MGGEPPPEYAFHGFRVALAIDCNGNGIADECDIGCGSIGGPCDVQGCGQSGDTNGDGIPDKCGACCTAAGCTQTIETLCVGPSKSKYHGDGTTCEEACPTGIPTVSEWGLVVLALLLLVAGKVYFGRKRNLA